MKNFPNQASSFPRIRAALALIDELNRSGRDPSSSDVLGYACAERGIYTFRNLNFATASKAELNARIAQMRTKPAADQGPLTFARDLRRTLRYLGWIDHDADLTNRGEALLRSEPNSVEEQALLVEGLLNIVVTEMDGSDPHHPVPVLLKLLAHSPSHRREGLELAFEPKDDSDAEFQRVLRLYPLPRAERIQRIGTTPSQRANAVKIIPTLAVAAGLVVEDGDGFFSLSQDGWQILGQSPTAPSAPAAAKQTIAKRGRRTTVGKLVTSETIAKRRSNRPPRTLTDEEQRRASERLQERTTDHQALVTRMAQLIGDYHGKFFEDEFSYDMLWAPNDDQMPAILFEMKTVTSDTDAYARIRHAVGQLSYYDYFHASPRLPGRDIKRCAVLDTEVPEELCDYMTHEGVAAIAYPAGASPSALNPLGQQLLAPLPQTQAVP